MQTLRGELHIDQKLFKGKFLEHLPTDIQTILPSSSEDLLVSRLAEIADRMLEVQRFQPPSIAQLTISPLPTPNVHLVTQMAAMTAEMDLLKLQLARLTSRLSSSHSSSHHRSHSRPQTVDLSRREFSFSLAGDVYVRYQSFNDALSLRKELVKTCPHKIDIGAVYSASPTLQRSLSASSFKEVKRLIPHMREIARRHVKKESSQPDSQTTSLPLHITHIGLTARPVGSGQVSARIWWFLGARARDQGWR
ncbi:unnamed protein product [Schistocephalus solidus]|uniref:Uncharacterized protein n=1 Tax=Schistocephalus solidus TaxID=70667 RepID=A0A183SMT1_SCHSO|nr:unnamed protein product [Schistocephalus solidus]